MSAELRGAVVMREISEPFSISNQLLLRRLFRIYEISSAFYLTHFFLLIISASGPDTPAPNPGFYFYRQNQELLPQHPCPFAKHFFVLVQTQSA